MEGLAVDQLRGEDINQSFRHLNQGEVKTPAIRALFKGVNYQVNRGR